MTKRSEFIFNKLGELFPFAHCELEYHNNFELIVMVSLSAQTTDTKVNSVAKVLFSKYPDAFKMSIASFSDIYDIIKPLGLANNKTKNIIELSKRLVAEKNGELPNDYDYLASLPGVGRKTANVVLSEAFGENRLAVDTHVARVSYRLNLTNSTDPLIVESDLVKEFDNVKLHTLHHRLIFMGRYLCKSINPKCSECPFIDYCREKSNGWKKDFKKPRTYSNCLVYFGSCVYFTSWICWR